MRRPKDTPERPPIPGQPFRDDAPLFSIIVVDYEPSVTREQFRRKMASLADQTCKDFEVLVYHDGPKSQSYADDLVGAPFHPATEFVVTPTHVGDWGHSNRDLGIRAARGRWIIHTNADNVLYPNLIETLKGVLEDPAGWAFAKPRRRRIAFRPAWLSRLLGRYFESSMARDPVPIIAEPQALVFAVILRGMVPCGPGTIRVREMAERQGMIYAGFPVRYGAIDAMQFVMRRDLWLAEGGWHDRAMNSDGLMYPAFARKYRVLPVPVVLGEHW